MVTRHLSSPSFCVVLVPAVGQSVAPGPQTGSHLWSAVMQKEVNINIYRVRKENDFFSRSFFLGKRMEDSTVLLQAAVQVGCSHTDAGQRLLF